MLDRGNYEMSNQSSDGEDRSLKSSLLHSDSDAEEMRSWTDSGVQTEPCSEPQTPRRSNTRVGNEADRRRARQLTQEVDLTKSIL